MEWRGGKNIRTHFMAIFIFSRPCTKFLLHFRDRPCSGAITDLKNVTCFSLSPTLTVQMSPQKKQLRFTEFEQVYLET